MRGRGDWLAWQQALAGRTALGVMPSRLASSSARISPRFLIVSRIARRVDDCAVVVTFSVYPFVGISKV